MQSRPPDLSDAIVAAAVTDGWRLPVRRATYQPVGYGSHHWRVDDGSGPGWFVSVDVLSDGRVCADRLSRALRLATAARDHGLAFVVAPLPAADGSLLHRVLDRYAMAVYPYVDGAAAGFFDRLAPPEAAELTAMVASVHDVPIPASAWVETFAVPGRAGLEAALASGSRSGPYGARLHDLLGRHGDDVARALERHDRLLGGSRPARERFVLTHGEPHPGNVLRTSEGLALVDWDTALAAPPERDLWLLDARSGGQASADYAARTGRRPVPAMMARYALAWSLTDVAVFVSMLGDADEETADTAWSWDALQEAVASLVTASGSDHSGEDADDVLGTHR